MPLDYSDVRRSCLPCQAWRPRYFGHLRDPVESVLIRGALGHLADFLVLGVILPWRGRMRNEETSGGATRQHYGAACPLCLDDCLSMGPPSQ